MKTISDNIKPILSVIIVVMGLAYFFMCSIRNLKPDPQILIAIVSMVSAVTGYHFGSSSGSTKKDEAITATMDKPLVTNADTVNVK